jgi:hypothetical protein
MYILKVFVFALTAAGISPDPIHTLHRPDKFATEQECTGFFDTDQGKAEQQTLLADIAEHMKGEGYAVAYSCKPEGSQGDHPKADDGKI